MGAVSGQATTFNLLNYVGELFHITPSETPFLSMIGGLTGGLRTKSPQFTWQTDDNAAAAQPAILEGASVTAGERSRSEVQNVAQIFQEAIELTYRKLAATGQLGGESILGTQPVQNEAARQRDLKLKKIARDVEFTFLQGTYQKPVDNTTAYKTRGMSAAITTNSNAAAGAQLSKDLIDDLLVDMFDSGAPFLTPVFVVNGYQKRKLNDIYGYAPESRNVGGVAISQIETDDGLIGIVRDRHQPAAELAVFDVAVCAPVILADDTGEVPPPFSFEPLGKDASSNKEQCYGEIGLHYGPEQWHGQITGLATS
jgi:hypothetical protein